MLNDLWLRLRALFRRKAVESELDAELRFHLESQIEKYVQSGLTREEAKRRAQIELGGVEQVKEQCRDARGIGFLEDTWRDVCYAARMLRKSPGFTVVAILTLALGIGANTAIFSVVNAVLIRGLPFPNSGRLAALFQTPEGMTGVMGWAPSGPDIVDWQRDSHSFNAISASIEDSATLTGSVAPRYVRGERVTANYFSLLGTQAAVGRTFASNEDEPGHDQVAILGYGLWRSAFGRRRILGHSIQLDGRVFTVIGIMPAAFHDPRTWMNPEAQFWIPLPQPQLEASRGTHMYAALGRLKPGVTFAQAQQEMSAIGRAEAKRYPNSNEGFGVRVSPLESVSLMSSLLGHFRSIAPQILLLQFAAVFLLLLVCANLASSVLSHSFGRHRELAVRGALGATGWRLARQSLTESILLSLLGGAVGVLFAAWGKGALLALAPKGYLPPTANVSLDWRVLECSFAVAALSGILFGLYPALRAGRQDPNEELKGAGTGAVRLGAISRVRRVLVVFEVAVAFLLLVCGGLVTRSLVSLTSVNPGFNPRDFLTAGVNLPAGRYAKPKEIAQLFRTAQEKIAALPGVKAVAFTSSPEFSVNGATSIHVEGRTGLRGDPWPQIAVVSTGFFRAAGIPILAGRSFSAADTAGAAKTVIVSHALAQYFWPKGSALGGHLKCCGVPGWIEVVGIAGNVRQNGLGSPSRPEIYFPMSFDTVQSQMNIVLRSPLPPQATEGEIEKQIWSIDPQIPLSRVRTGNQIIAGWAGNSRYRALLLSSFALMALLVALTGVLGAMTYATTQRTHEIGIRMALGAQRSEVLRMVIREGMLLASVGVAIGAGAALALTRLMRSFLFEVSPNDPSTFVGVAIALTLVALFACYVPARRAMRVDPMTALRHE